MNVFGRTAVMEAQQFNFEEIVNMFLAKTPGGNVGAEEDVAS
jgi:hypothetical protein